MSSKGENPADLTTEEARILSTLARKGRTSTKHQRSGHVVTYEGLEELAAENPRMSIDKILKSLQDKGYLRESYYDYILLCPNCDSFNIYTNYSCPYCQSVKIKKTKLAEHKLCGYIGDLDEFSKLDGYLCPQCKTRLETTAAALPQLLRSKTEALRVIGSSFICDKCGAKFEKPNIVHTCDQCSRDFTYKEANYARLPAYEVVKKIEFTTPTQSGSDNVEEKEVTAKPPNTQLVQDGTSTSPSKSVNEALKGIESAFTERGFTFEYGVKLRGKSGAEQSFAAAAIKGKLKVLIDVSQTGNLVDVVSLVGKKKDIDLESIILIDITGNPYLASMGERYKIAVLDWKNGEHSKLLAGILDDAGENKND